MIDLLNKTHGKCPYCKSKDLDMGEYTSIHDFTAYYPIKCNKCKRKFKEMYEMKFVGNWGRK